MKPGDLMKSDACNLWEKDTRAGDSSIVGYLEYGDLVLVLEEKLGDALVLGPDGIIGWIDGMAGGARKRLHEV